MAYAREEEGAQELQEQALPNRGRQRRASAAKRSPLHAGLCGRVEGAERGIGGVEDRRGAWEPADRGTPGGRTRANAGATDEERGAAIATRASENRTPDRPGALRCGAARRNGTETRQATQPEAGFAEAGEKP